MTAKEAFEKELKIVMAQLLDFSTSYTRTKQLLKYAKQLKRQIKKNA